MSAPRRFAIHNLAVTALLGALQSAPVFAEPPARVATPIKYEITLDDALPAVRDMRMSAARETFDRDPKAMLTERGNGGLTRFPF